MSNLIHNEQVKLRAVFYNNSAVAAAFGVVVTTALALSHESMFAGLFTLVGGLPLAYFFHRTAIGILRELKE